MSDPTAITIEDDNVTIKQDDTVLHIQKPLLHMLTIMCLYADMESTRIVLQVHDFYVVADNDGDLIFDIDRDSEKFVIVPLSILLTIFDTEME